MDNQKHSEKITDTMLSVWYQSILQSAADLGGSNDNLLSRINNLLGITTAFLPIATTLLVETIISTKNILSILIILGLLSVLALTIYLAIIVRPHKDSSLINSYTDHPEYENQDDRQFLYQMIADTENVIKGKSSENKKLGTRLFIAIIWFIASVLFITII
ncbi:MAG: hypothetical protein LBM09_01995, partial [Candidatus Nomurabacteria bacterium]|nr:hypothetical protein [Candidatus Nomurabacteria bacterium]